MAISAGQPVPTEDEQGGSQVGVIQEGEEEEDGKDGEVCGRQDSICTGKNLWNNSGRKGLVRR